MQRVVTLILVCTLILSSCLGATSYAAKCDTAFYGGNDILFTNPCEAPCSTTSGTGSITTLRGSNNAEKIYNFWLDAGLTPQQSAGILASIKEESGFSPFTQEIGYPWETGGWGIAQFTNIPGERADIKAYVSKAIGADLFNQYYKNDYGGLTLQSQGYVPNGVPQDVNDKFLLSELDYLQDIVKQTKPNSTRTSAYQADFGKAVDPSLTVFDYLKTLSTPTEAAVAWTYLYEWPGNPKPTAEKRAGMADQLLSLFSGATASASNFSSACSPGLIAGGINSDKAKAFMESYVSDPKALSLLGGAGTGCSGGPLANCVSFSVYFINKYTTLQGFATGAPGNGNEVVGNIAARNPSVKTGTVPKPYAIFSLTNQGSPGHTGVILGVDTEHKKVIVGEASCGDSMAWITDYSNHHVYDLAQFSDGSHTYAYTDGMLKGNIGN